MDFGDRPIDTKEPMFTRGDAVEITGVPAKTIDNWTQRGLIDLGVMHRTGRRLYSMVDLIELKIVGELSMMVQMSPAQAAAAAAWARKRHFQLGERDAKGPAEKRHFLRIWFDRDGLKIVLHEGVDWLAQYSVPFPVVIVPLDDIINHILNAAFDVLEREAPESELGDVLADAISNASKHREAKGADTLPKAVSRDDPEPDVMMRWDTDRAGNKILVGLSNKETDEYIEVQAEVLRGYRAARGTPSSPDRGARYLELHDKHERARHERMARTRDARMKKGKK